MAAGKFQFTEESYTLLWNTTTISSESGNLSQSLKLANTSKLRKLTIALSMVIVCLGLFLVVANIMVIIAPLYHKGLRRKTFIIVSSLAVTDLLMGVLHPAARIMGVIVVIRPVWFIQTDIYCKTILFFNYFPTIASILHLLLIAAERYMAIVHPLHYKTVLSPTCTAILITLAWLTSLALSIIGPAMTKKGRLQCHLTDQSPLAFHLGIGLIYWLLMTAMLVLYIRMFISIRRSRNLRSAVGSGLRATKVSSEKSVALMLFIAFGIFAVCYTPHLIMLHLLMEGKVQLTAVFPTYVLSYLNSCMNVFVYAAQSPKYRHAFERMCCTKRYRCSTYFRRVRKTDETFIPISYVKA